MTVLLVMFVGVAGVGVAAETVRRIVWCRLCGIPEEDSPPPPPVRLRPNVASESALTARAWAA